LTAIRRWQRYQHHLHGGPKRRVPELTRPLRYRLVPFCFDGIGYRDLRQCSHVTLKRHRKRHKPDIGCDDDITASTDERFRPHRFTDPEYASPIPVGGIAWITPGIARTSPLPRDKNRLLRWP